MPNTKANILFRRCAGCDELKARDSYPNDRTRHGGFGYYCKVCHHAQYLKRKEKKPNANKEYAILYRKKFPERAKAATERWRANNPGRLLAARRKREYGITPEQTRLMLGEQNNCCAICSQRFVGTGFVVDHDHKTGQVRGLLCQVCNRGLGMFRDDPKRLISAIKYLESLAGVAA